MSLTTIRSFNQGQICAASSRIFVQESIYDNFLERFTAKAKSLNVGDPFAPDAYNGPQISQTQLDRVMGYIDSGKQEGATVHLDGGRSEGGGYFIKPTIFTDTKPEMKIVKEEIFGPVAVLIRFKDEEGESSNFRERASTNLNAFACRGHPHG
jgi:aldehyde dehydrogenase (NAD+)